MKKIAFPHDFRHPESPPRRSGFIRIIHPFEEPSPVYHVSAASSIPRAPGNAAEHGGGFMNKL
jgi:hypothetical protein